MSRTIGDELAETVQQAAGMASVAWDNMSGAGVFQPDVAIKASDMTMDHVTGLMEEFATWLLTHVTWRPLGSSLPPGQSFLEGARAHIPDGQTQVPAPCYDGSAMVEAFLAEPA